MVCGCAYKTVHSNQTEQSIAVNLTAYTIYIHYIAAAVAIFGHEFT